MAKNKLRRKSNKASAYKVFATVSVIIISAIAMGAFFRVVDIEVSGATHYSREEIISLSGISTGSSMFLIDVQYTHDRILGEKPIIYDVRVQRALPHRAIIHVYESIPIAMLPYEDSFLIIDTAARVIGKSNDMPNDLVEIRGFEAANPTLGMVLTPEDGVQSRLRIMIEVLSAMQNTEIYSLVSFLDVSSIARVFFDFGVTTIFLGTPDGTERKLGSIERAFLQYEICHLSNRGRLDMSHRDDWTWNPE